MKPALLIIDMQKALCSGDEAAFDIDRVLDRCSQLAARAQAAAAPVILIQHEEAEGSLQFGTAGWQLDERLLVHPDHQRVRKTATDSFYRTGLQSMLQSHGIGRLVICGLQSEFCVDSTVRAALALGYPVTLVSDAHSTVDNGVLSAAQISAHHNATLANLGSFGPRVTISLAAQLSFAD
jgi:nicotinamidase-related amidase